MSPFPYDAGTLARLEARMTVLTLLLAALDDALEAWRREAEVSILMPQTTAACERLAVLQRQYERT